MKKTTVLSLLTAGAILITGAGTYATWDQITDTSEAQTVTFRAPVAVEVTGLTLSSDEFALGATDTPTASGTANITVSDAGNKADTLKLTPAVSGSGVTLDDFDITITDTTVGHNTALTTQTGYWEDKDYDASGTANTYTVTLKAKEASKAKFTGQNIEVTLKAELVAAPVA